MNKLEIAKKSQEVPSRDFLIWLCQVKDVIKNHELLRFIKSTLREFRRYASYSFISSVKGVFGRKGDAGVAPDYYDYEKTDRFQNRMNMLWKFVGMDDRYFSKTVLENYEILKTMCSEKELENLYLDKDGNFVINQDGQEVPVNVMSAEELEDFEEFINSDDKYRYKEINGQLVLNEMEEFFLAKRRREDGEDECLIVRMNAAAVRAYMASKRVKRVAEHKQEQFGPEIIMKTERLKHEEKAEIIADPDMKWVKVSSEMDKDIKKKILSISMNSPEQMQRINVRFFAHQSLVTGKDASGNILIRIPAGFTNKNKNQFIRTGSSQYIGKYFKIPGDRVEILKNGNARITGITLNEKFDLCDTNGQILKTADGKPIQVPAVAIAEQFTIAEVMVSHEQSKDHNVVMIDGETMDRVTTDTGYTFAYSQGDPGRAVILKYTGTEKEVHIPGTLKIDGNEYPVTEIKDGAFENCSATVIDVPSGVKEIRNRAFANCPLLEKLTLHDGIEEIGDYAFAETKISELKLPSTVREIGHNLVANCPRINNIECAVNDINGLHSENGVLFNGSKLSAYPIGRSDTMYVIPDGTTEISDSAFSGSKLCSVTLPNSLTVIGNSAFENSVDLSLVNVGESLENIGNQAFADCPKLDAFDFSHVKNIGRRGFMNTSLKEIQMDDISVVHEEAFKNNLHLSEFNLNSENAHIDITAFNNCPVKTEIRGMATVRQDLQISTGMDVEPEIEQKQVVENPEKKNRLIETSIER